MADLAQEVAHAGMILEGDARVRDRTWQSIHRTGCPTRGRVLAEWDKMAICAMTIYGPYRRTVRRSLTSLDRSSVAPGGELMVNVREYLRSTQQQPKQLRRYFHRRSVRYVAAMSKSYSFAQ